MPPFDREGALKTAEKALRQGRIDAAIAEYVRIVEAQPRDWNSANALGDLYVRASQVERGLAQYTRIADHLQNEGFYQKAAALYKKILKIKPDLESGLHFCFVATSEEAVNAFYAAALANGGEDNGAPGIRPDYSQFYYAAFIIDPDGYRLEAFFNKPE